jgi:hypothetical protein
MGLFLGLKRKTSESHARLDGVEVTDSTPSAGCCSGVNILEPISLSARSCHSGGGEKGVGGMMEGSNMGREVFGLEFPPEEKSTKESSAMQSLCLQSFQVVDVTTVPF